jgi:hypothetical protein
MDSWGALSVEFAASAVSARDEGSTKRPKTVHTSRPLFFLVSVVCLRPFVVALTTHEYLHSAPLAPDGVNGFSKTLFLNTSVNKSDSKLKINTVLDSNIIVFPDIMVVAYWHGLVSKKIVHHVTGRWNVRNLNMRVDTNAPRVL